MTNKILVTKANGDKIGYIVMGGFLPDFIMINKELYQRYGEVSNYRYVREDSLFIPNEGELIIEEN